MKCGKTRTLSSDSDYSATVGLRECSKKPRLKSAPFIYCVEATGLVQQWCMRVLGCQL